MLAQWLTVLTAYSFEIVHRKGTKHGNADMLSREPRRCKCDSCPDCKSTELVCAAGHTGKGCKKPCGATWLVRGRLLWVHWSALVVYGVLYRKWLPEGNGNQPYIHLVLPQFLRKVFFKELHSKRVAGHFGITQTLAQVRRRFYRPRCKADIRRWCRQY